MRKIILHIIFIIISVIIVGHNYLSDRKPVFDERVYLAYAYSLAKHNTFGLISSKNIEINPGPSSRVSPIVPAIQALVMKIDNNYLKEIECFFNKKSNCKYESKTLKYIQLLLFSLALSIVWLCLFNITGSLSIPYFTILSIMFFGEPFEYANQHNTESIYLPLFFIFCSIFSLAIIRKKIIYIFLSAMILGLVALSRPPYYYLFYMLLFSLPLLLIIFYHKKYTFSEVSKYLFIFFIGFFCVTGPWIARNIDLYGKPSITVGYGNRALSHRIAYNRMNNDEYIAGWVYWLPDFGDSLAKKLFPEESYIRLDMSTKEGFYKKVADDIQNEINEKTGSDITFYKHGQNQVSTFWIIKEYVLNDIINHLKVTLLLMWRGIFLNSYFGLLGLPILFWAMSNKSIITSERRDYLRIITIICFMIAVFYASVSINIARYNLPLLLPMSIGYAVILSAIFSKLKIVMCNLKSQKIRIE